MEQGQKIIYDYFEQAAKKRDKWKRRNRFYQKTIEKQFQFIIPQGAVVMELGCSTGDLLNAVKPSKGIGVDFSENALQVAKGKHPHIEFIHADVLEFQWEEPIEYIIISDLITSLWDVQTFFHRLRKCVLPTTKIIISSYNYIWEPILRLGEFFRLKAKQPLQNWLSIKDISNLLYLENFEIIKVEKKLLFPKYIPVINLIFNKFFGNLPWINNLDLVQFITDRKSVV